jgi:hypothetical protein
MTVKEFLQAIPNSDNTGVYLCGTWTGSAEDLTTLNIPIDTAVYEAGNGIKIYIKERNNEQTNQLG